MGSSFWSFADADITKTGIGTLLFNLFCDCPAVLLSGDFYDSEWRIADDPENKNPSVHFFSSDRSTAALGCPHAPHALRVLYPCGQVSYCAQPVRRSSGRAAFKVSTSSSTSELFSCRTCA